MKFQREKNNNWLRYNKKSNHVLSLILGTLIYQTRFFSVIIVMKINYISKQHKMVNISLTPRLHILNTRTPNLYFQNNYAIQFDFL